MDLQGISSIVTGGSSGLGAAVARLLAEQGCRVSVLDRQSPATMADSVAEHVDHHRCDITDEFSVQAALETAAARHGPPRIVVNCAGLGDSARVLGRDGPASLNGFRRVLDVNVTGTFNVIRLAMAQLAQADELPGFGRGVIVNTASIAAFDGQTGQAAYAASKAAIVGMTLPLARELARIAVRVMTVCPGVFLTPMVAGHVSDTVLDGLLASSAYPRRGGNPAEFADLVLSIVRNPMLNGESIRIDGGLRMPTL
jgi:NAD(P)-dependent dehydrogenase (short-subunit alcohol dehydrogenase family)